jgi:hypothetical protein
MISAAARVTHAERRSTGGTGEAAAAGRIGTTTGADEPRTDALADRVVATVDGGAIAAPVCGSDAVRDCRYAGGVAPTKTCFDTEGTHFCTPFTVTGRSTNSM